jgi:hypothetical protein
MNNSDIFLQSCWPVLPKVSGIDEEKIICNEKQIITPVSNKINVQK